MTKQKRFMKTNKLSEILTIALDDLELVEKDSSYIINMNVWQYQGEDEQEPCEVCLAGSVLAKTFGFYKETISSLKGLLTVDARNRLHAIDSMRVGHLRSALKYLGLHEEHDAINEIMNVANITGGHQDIEFILGESWFDFNHALDCHDFKDFVTFYRGVASKLKEVGL